MITENSGSRSEALWSPKLNLTFGPWARTEYYVNFGYGHHSNDARGTTIRIDPAILSISIARGYPAAGIADVHFHPVEDRTLRLLVGTSF